MLICLALQPTVVTCYIYHIKHNHVPGLRDELNGRLIRQKRFPVPFWTDLKSCLDKFKTYAKQTMHMFSAHQSFMLLELTVLLDYLSILSVGAILNNSLSLYEVIRGSYFASLALCLNWPCRLRIPKSRYLF